MQMFSHRNHNDPAIVAQNLCVRFNDHIVIDHVSFAIPKGMITAIIGPNGSGKTTLVRSLIGLQEIHSGSITLFGESLINHNAVIGYVPQHVLFDRSLPMTCREFLSLMSHTSFKEINAVWKRIGLTKNIEHKKMGELSGGQLQRIFIAQALLQKPDILILDEPDANIDIVGERQLEDILKEYTRSGGTAIFISHDISFVARAVEHVICLNKQLVCTGSPQETLTQSTLKTLFQNASLYHHH